MPARSEDRSPDPTRARRSIRVFAPGTRFEDTRNERIYALYELAHTTVDFAAGVLFLVGSVMFFYDSLQRPATWCFLLGSILFVARPSIRLARELAFYRAGNTRTLAERASD